MSGNAPQTLSDLLLIDLGLDVALTHGSYRVTSPPDEAYNCFAWSTGNVDERYDPYDEGSPWHNEDFFKKRPSEQGKIIIELFTTLGFKPSDNDLWEDRCQKIAIYQKENGEVTHAIRILQSGIWASKLGDEEDIEHSAPSDFFGSGYGRKVTYMKRDWKHGDPMPPSEAQRPPAPYSERFG